MIPIKQTDERATDRDKDKDKDKDRKITILDRQRNKNEEHTQRSRQRHNVNIRDRTKYMENEIQGPTAEEYAGAIRSLHALTHIESHEAGAKTRN